jgi:transposase
MQANQEKVRRRRTYSVEFKLAAVRASQAPGASLSGVALARGLNANLLRRWVDEARSGTLRAAMKALAVPRASAEFVPLPLTTAQPEPIRITLQRGATAVQVSWPVNQAAHCAAWLRGLLG